MFHKISLLIFFILIKTALLEDPKPFSLKYSILLTLNKFEIEPSVGLCKELGMEKVQGNCVEKQNGFLKLRREDGRYSQKTLCSILQLSFCGNTCCLSRGKCQDNAIESNEENKIEIKKSQNICQKQQPTLEEQCKSSGLLWCANQCCGFSVKNHKCFKSNHYGVPYVRCPIQATQS